jgi:hypothetical protein
MKIPIHNKKNTFSGLIFVAFGLFTVFLSRTYSIGTAASMGPGYFPFILGALLIFLGLIVLAQGLLLRGVRDLRSSLMFKPLSWVLGSIIAFALLLKPMGFILSTGILIFMSSLASPEFGWKKAFVCTAILTAIAFGIFILGLRFDIPVLPGK